MGRRCMTGSRADAGQQVGPACAESAPALPLSAYVPASAAQRPSPALQPQSGNVPRPVGRCVRRRRGGGCVAGGAGTGGGGLGVVECRRSLTANEWLSKQGSWNVASLARQMQEQQEQGPLAWQLLACLPAGPFLSQQCTFRARHRSRFGKKRASGLPSCGWSAAGGHCWWTTGGATLRLGFDEGARGPGRERRDQGIEGRVGRARGRQAGGRLVVAKVGSRHLPARPPPAPVPARTRTVK